MGLQQGRPNGDGLPSQCQDIPEEVVDCWSRRTFSMRSNGQQVVGEGRDLEALACLVGMNDDLG